jgi:hypothetical protein
VVDLCRSVAEPQHDLGTQASPFRTRSPDPKVVAQSLVDDARTATPPPAADERGATPPPTTDSRTVTLPRADEAGAGGALGDVRTSASPQVIDVDPINVRPGGMEEDLVKDQAEIDQAPKGLRTSSTQVLTLLSLTTRLARTATATEMLVGAYKRHRQVHTSSNGARERLG